jgi:hypothetical protein
MGTCFPLHLSPLHLGYSVILTWHTLLGGFSLGICNSEILLSIALLIHKAITSCPCTTTTVIVTVTVGVILSSFACLLDLILLVLRAYLLIRVICILRGSIVCLSVFYAFCKALLGGRYDDAV